MRSHWGTALAAFTLALMIAPAGVHAATFVPTRHDDPNAGRCKPDDCSFREALSAANATHRKDTVLLGRGTYELELPPGGASFESGEFSIFNATTVRGKGRGKTRIDGNGVDRVIAIGSGITAFGTVEFDDLTIKGGDAGAPDVLHDSEGGGIFAAGEAGSNLVLTNVVVRGNDAEFGGGIFAYREMVHIKDSTISGNAATEGGGLHVIAAPAATDVAVRASTISGNSASKGGGVLADGSTFWGPDPPVVDFQNSTIAQNHTSAEGGGIMADNSATVTIDNTTVAYNMADDDNTGGGVAGGIYQHSDAVFNLDDSVIAENSVGSSGTGQQCGGDFLTNGSGNIIQASPGTCSFVGGGTISPDAKLGVLGDNGGPTKTIRLFSGSPALGAALSCPNRDQRGVERPSEDCDSGAFERRGA